MSLTGRPGFAVAGWEMRGAMRSRWVIVVAALYTLAAIGITLVSLRSMSSLGLRGVGAAIDGLIALAILVPPLFGILLGAGAISGAREQGMLALVTAQPIERRSITWGTVAGMVLVVWAGVGIGLGLAAAIVAPSVTAPDLAGLAVAILATLAAGAIGVGLGVLASVLASSRGQAMMIAVALWFLAALGIDVVLASMAPIALGPGVLLAVTLVNPLAALRTLAMLLVDPASLGGFGLYLDGRFGVAGALALFGVAVAAWILAPVLLASRVLHRTDI